MASAFVTSEKKAYPSWLILFEGVLAIIVGAMLLIWPVKTFTTLIFFLGIFWLVDGIFDIVSIFINRENWGWKLFMGVIGIMAGLFLIQTPLAGALVLSKTYVILIGLMGVLYGVLGMINGFRGAGIGAVIIGLISIVLGIFMLANSWAATLAVPAVFGIFTIIGGIAAVIFAFRMK